MLCGSRRQIKELPIIFPYLLGKSMCQKRKRNFWKQWWCLCCLIQHSSFYWDCCAGPVIKCAGSSAKCQNRAPSPAPQFMGDRQPQRTVTSLLPYAQYLYWVCSRGPRLVTCQACHGTDTLGWRQLPPCPSLKHYRTCTRFWPSLNPHPELLQGKRTATEGRFPPSAEVIWRLAQERMAVVVEGD